LTTWLDSLILRIKGNQKPSDEEEKFLRRGEIFLVLKGSEAWREVLDFLEKLADESLTALRLDKKHDPMNSLALQLRWQEREAVLRLLQEEVLSVSEQAEKFKQSNQKEGEWQNLTAN
jgi:hypothetical protein